MKKFFDLLGAFCEKHWFACDMITALGDLAILLMPFVAPNVSDASRYTMIIFEYGIMIYCIVGCGVLESIRKLKKAQR